MPYRIAIDVGGTFTDIVLHEGESGRLFHAKVPSTPDDPSLAMASGIEAAASLAPIRPDQIAEVGHGTTVATNAILQRKGAKTALLTTAGFTDLLEIGRQTRPSLYDLFCSKPEPLIPRDLRIAVKERTRYDGSIARPIDTDALKRSLTGLQGKKVEGLAISFLHSYVNPEHERTAEALAREALPDCFITSSHRVCPLFREFERTSTTAMNAYLSPVLSGYLSRIDSRLSKLGIDADPWIAQSDGSAMSVQTASEQPVRAVLSGPSAGATATAYLADSMGIDRAIGLDMGGTSCDVFVTEGGSPAVTFERELDGLPIQMPAMDIHTVGAGGGSIASVDKAGFLKVGPESAGAEPGPACYGKGGTHPTVTDANLVLGRLGVDDRLAGSVALSADMGAEAIEEKIARRLGMDTTQAAAGIIEVANTNMRSAVEAVTVRRGRDPREFALVAYGGAGPMHACELAAQLGIQRVIVPPSPGTFSAFGLLTSDLSYEFVQTRITPLEPFDKPAIQATIRHLSEQADEWLAAHSQGEKRLQWSVAARYKGQDYELRIDLDDPAVDSAFPERVSSAFEKEHHARYGYTVPGRPVEIVHFSVRATVVLPKPGFARPPKPAQESPEGVTTRPVYFDGKAHDAPVFDRADLPPSEPLRGPVIVTQTDSTVVVPPGFGARVLGNSALELTKDG